MADRHIDSLSALRELAGFSGGDYCEMPGTCPVGVVVFGINSEDDVMEFRVEKNPSGVVVVFPRGVLDASVAPEFRGELLALASDGNKQIVVNLSGVEIIDSSGLGALIDGLKAMRKNGGDLRIADLNDQVAAIVDLTKLGGILRLVDGPGSVGE